MLRARTLLPICLAALISVCIGHDLLVAPLHAASTAECASLQAATGPAHTHPAFAAVDRFGHGTILHTAEVSFKTSRSDGGPLGRLVLRALRAARAGALRDLAVGPAASRVRAVQRDALAFSSELAAARTGTVSSPSTAPPHSFL